MDKADKDRIEGSTRKLKGDLKKVAGKVLGDQKMQREGKADKAAGKAQNAVGSAREAPKEKRG